MHHPSTDKLNQPLSDADWERLAEILEQTNASVDIEAMDGLLAAFACGPRELMPSDVLPLAYDDEVLPEFADAGQARRARRPE